MKVWESADLCTEKYLYNLTQQSNKLTNEKIFTFDTRSHDIGGVNSYAKKVNANLNMLNNGPSSTWNSDNNTMTWKQSTNNMISGFTFTENGQNFTSGDFNIYNKLVVKVSKLTNADAIRVQIRANGKEPWKILTGEETHELSLTTDFGLTAEDLTHVEWIRLLGNNYYDSHQSGWSATNTASAIIDEVYLVRNTLVFDGNGVATIDFSDITFNGCLSFNPETGVLTNNYASEADGDSRFTINMSGGEDMSNVYGFRIHYTGSMVLGNIYLNGSPNVTFGNSEDGRTNIASNMASQTNVTSWAWGVKNTTGTMTITSIEFYSTLIACNNRDGETQLNTLLWFVKSTGYVEEPAWNMGTSTGTYYGTGEGQNATNYVDLTGYETLRIYRDTNTDFRAFFINSAGTGVNNYNGNSSNVSWNSTGNYWEINLSQVEKYNGMVALQGIKSKDSSTSDIVNNITVYKTPNPDMPYSFSGKGVLSTAAKAALADATTASYDATGVIGSGVTIVPENPNAIIKANTGVLTNSKNILVGTTIANLVLTDGYPFEVPEDATATAATYTRNMSSQYGTICLPYAVSSNENVRYYTLGAMGTETITLEPVDNLLAGTPAIVEKLSGSSITASGSGTLAVAGNETQGLQAYGSYVAKTVVPSDYPGKNIYALATVGGEQALWQTDNSINVLPFRAYFVTADSNNAKLRFVPEESTDINVLAGKGAVSVEGIYSANGARQPSLQKGLNVVKMSNGEVKKVYVK